ncbi:MULTISPECIES: cytochrome P450 [Actinoplanes]|uniref:cytochrome P450 family protein n=1 Tax=Actinoplanes TaxID=1865 RepID=UPI0005F27E46|nr:MULTISPECIES: cytochrome P450 [Actinoplanes]GLY05429.1 cytochrome P450 hydroxylase [Actinoplanes sp. NBRC 101535]
MFSDDFHTDPYAMFGQLRDTAPAVPVNLPDGSPVWLVTRYADVRALLADPRLSVDKATGDGTWRGFALPPALDANLLNMDPPHHTRIRRLVSQAFTPRRVESLRPLIATTAEELLDRLPTGEPADLIRGYAGPLPVAVISDLLGVPDEDRDRFRSWTDVMLVPPHDDPKAGVRAIVAIHAYLQQLLAAKRAEPAGDLLSALIAAREEGDRLSEDELTSLAFLLLLAGYENTVHAIGTGILTLLTRDVDRTGDLGPLVEELLRFEPPATVLLRRFTTEDVDVSGVTIPRGRTVLMVVGAANRDPDAFPGPDEVRPGRAGGHLTFGHGIHYCVAAPLARIELEIAIGAVIRRFPDLSLAVPAGELRWRPSFRARGLIDLPVRLYPEV